MMSGRRWVRGMPPRMHCHTHLKRARELGALEPSDSCLFEGAGLRLELCSECGRYLASLPPEIETDTFPTSRIWTSESHDVDTEEDESDENENLPVTVGVEEWVYSDTAVLREGEVYYRSPAPITDHSSSWQ